MTNPKKRRESKPGLSQMDYAVICIIGISLLVGAGLMIFSFAGVDPKFEAAFYRRHAILLYIYALGNSGTLFLWMMLGGKKSLLWDRLPPFTVASKNPGLRWPFIIVLILGTIVAAIGLGNSQ